MKKIYKKEKQIKLNNKTPLHIAASKNYIEIADSLIQFGADINKEAE